MNSKKIKAFCSVDNTDNTKTTLFVTDEEIDREMVRNALIEFDSNLLTDDEKRFEIEVDSILLCSECSFGDTEFFFEDVTYLYQ